MRYDAGDPDWPDRDRFVLSAGHASILLYSMLHLTGLRPHPRRPPRLPAVGLEDARATPSAATPTASRSPPARSARASATRSGMALAERQLRARFGADVVDHRTFCIVGDGDLSEGLSPRGRLARRPPRPRPPRVRLRRQPRLDRRPHRARPQRRRRRPLPRPTGGTSRTWARRPRTSTPSRPPCSERSPRRTARRCSSCAATSPSRPPPRPTTPPPTATPSRTTRSARPRRSWACPTRRSTSPTTCASSTGRGRARPRRAGGVGRSGSRPTTGDRAALDARSARPGVPGWADALPTLGAGREARHPRRQRQGAPGPRRRRPVPPGRRRRPHVATPARCSRTTACSPSTSPAAARSTSASASTPWPPR